MGISDGKCNFWNKKTIVSYFLAVLVFWIHCSSFANYAVKDTWINYVSIFFKEFFNPIAVPLFLIISGALFFRDYTDKKYLQKLKKRVHSLMIPFLLWNVLNMLFDIFASHFFSKYFIGREVFQFSAENILEGIFHYKYNAPFWFVFALIVFSLAAPIIDKLLYRKWVGIIAITLIMIGTQFGIGLPTPLFFNQSCLVYYLVGAFIGKFYFENFSKMETTKPMMIISAIMLLLYCVSRFLSLQGVYSESSFMNEVSLATASLSLWCLFNLVCKKVKSKDYMTHSFWVFALHRNVSAVATKLLWMVLPKSFEFSIVNFVLTTLLTLILIELLCQFTKMVCKPLYLWLSGNRE